MAQSSLDRLRAENEELRLRLEEAEQALEAIRSGQVDSLVVEGTDGPHIFTLESAAHSYRVLVESMNEGAATLREDGTVLYCNRHFAGLVGVPLQRLMGSALRDHVTEPGRAALEALLERARDGSAREELRLLGADGEEIPAYLSVSSIVDGGWRVLCVVATDLREQRRTQAILAAERAARESEERLRLAAEELRAADQRKDAFLGMLSHELRNPLAPIRNSIYILDHADPSGSQAARAREVIGRQVEHITKLVDDLLDVTRIARGKIELQRDRLDLALLVRRVSDDHASLLQERGIGFELDAPDEPLWAGGDPTRLTQIVGNLLQNAAKFTARGGKVTLALGVVRGGAEIRVRDTGVGIEPEILERIFEPFVQADRSLARSAGGLGLGLALVKSLVELHGGSVSAYSAGSGRGAEFVVTLPLDPAQRPRPGTAGSRESTCRVRRILVIEDNADVAESLRQVLELKRHVVEIARTGPEGVSRAQLFQPEVVLCDIGLPGMDGFAVARALRAHPSLRTTTLIAFSGYGSAEDLERARVAGFDQHVAKPIDPEDLDRIVNRVAGSKER
jgi:PAS domain S-box-containing protein